MQGTTTLNIFSTPSTVLMTPYLLIVLLTERYCGAIQFRSNILHCCSQNFCAKVKCKRFLCLVQCLACHKLAVVTTVHSHTEGLEWFSRLDFTKYSVPAKLRVFGNMVLRRIFGPRRDEVTGQ